jgi:hypothetical protein
MEIDAELLLKILERTENKLDSLLEKTADHNASLQIQGQRLGEYNDHLKEHMRRTDLLEQRIVPLENDLTVRETKKSYVAQHWKTIVVIFTAIAGTLGAIWSAMQILGINKL